MPTFQLGSDSEFVRVSLHTPYSDEGWCPATVEVALPCFRGEIRPWLGAGDIARFKRELKLLYESLKGEAKLSPVEGQFTLHIKAGTAGHITVQGVAWSEATYGDRLEFTLELDQSYLSRTLAELSNATSAG